MMVDSVRAAEKVLDFDSLLEFLPVVRRPQDFYHKVEESCAIGENELRRRVDIQLSARALALRHLIIDLMHPDKGKVMHVQMLSNAEAVTVLGHVDHLRIVRSLIVTRLNRFLETALIPAASELQFAMEWERIFADLAALPNLSPDQAARSLRDHFDLNGRLRIMLKFPNVAAPEEIQRGLYALCKRVATKYFLLVRVDVGKMSSPTLSFEYRHEVTEHVFDPPKDARNSSNRTLADSSSSFADRGPTIGRRNKHGVAPVSFRVHVPWAKRTNNYTFSMDSPPGHFIAYEELLEKPRGSYPRIVRANDSSHLGYSISNEQGRRIRIFVREGRKNRLPLFLAVRHDELPSRTTSRAFLIACSALVGILVFSVGNIFFTGDQSNAAALVCAALALGVFVSTPPAGPGVLGHPRLPRISIAALTIITAGFALWLTGRKLVWAYGRALPDETVTYLNLIWVQVNLLGWIPFALAASIVAVLLGRRRKKLREHFSHTTSTGPKLSGNFFS